eukprot:7385370-Prymnesium_polylepis.1
MARVRDAPAGCTRASGRGRTDTDERGVPRINTQSRCRHGLRVQGSGMGGVKGGASRARHACV